MRTASILLPARNEEAGLAATLAEIPYRELRLAGYQLDVVVVDGSSTDRTTEVARLWGARVVQQAGRGKGLAVRSALPALRGEFVVMVDADRTYPAWEAPRFLERLEAGADVVMGSRMRGAIRPGAMRPLHRFGNHGLSLMASVLTGRRVSDVCTGMWAFRRNAVLDLPLESSEFQIEAELYSRAVEAGLRIEELPIEYRPRLGRTKLGGVRDGLVIGRALVDLAADRWRRPRTRVPSKPIVPTAPRS